MHFAYLYSRYPVLSQTFCDTEMLALERRGWSFEIGSIHPPLTSLRHEHAAQLQAPIYYAPPQEILKIRERKAKRDGTWPLALVARHEQRYGPTAKASLRARNALYFADLFARHRVEHFHVHFANRAAQTALFVKAISGIPFSVTAHGQDFMVDLGNVELLREICAEAEFVAAETNYSRDLLRTRCPGAAGKIHRVYNGMNLVNFPAPAVSPEPRREGPVRILSVGRLVEFKGFHDLLAACRELQRRGCDFHCEIVGEGPLREALAAEIAQLQLEEQVTLAGARSQEEVFSRLRSCDVFALASVVDRGGASDVFPTVILEAMASGRPVVSTTIAGIPEAVVDGETGLLVAPNDPVALASALEKLVQNPALRSELGAAGRRRVEENFQVDTTVRPLEEMLRASLSLGRKTEAAPAAASAARRAIVYLVDTWPDRALPNLENEIEELRERGVPVLPVICRVSASERAASEFALTAEFLPDAIVQEAEWQEQRALAREFEAEHAASLQRVPGALFLEQARYALLLRKLLRRDRLTHLHATSSRALVAALLLRKLLPLTVTAAIELRPTLSRNALKDALRLLDGGRVFDPGLVRHAPGAFVIETRPGALSRLLPQRGKKVSQEWAERLLAFQKG